MLIHALHSICFMTSLLCLHCCAWAHLQEAEQHVLDVSQELCVLRDYHQGPIHAVYPSPAPLAYLAARSPSSLASAMLVLKASATSLLDALKRVAKDLHF